MSQQITIEDAIVTASVVTKETTSTKTDLIVYPQFDLVKNKVTIFKGLEFDINDFICLTMLTNHEPDMVDMVQIFGQDTHIYYCDGTTRVVTLEDRRVLWEKYTELLISVRRHMLPITNPNHPDYVEPLKIKENKVIIIS